MPFVKLFRKGTLPNVLQTVHAGPNKAEWVLKQALKFPNRKYAAADPPYKKHPERFSDVVKIGLMGIIQ